MDEKGLRTRIFKAGVEPGIRKEVWQYLLGLHPAGKTAAHRKGLVQGLRQEYEQLKAQWTTIADKQAARSAFAPSLHILTNSRNSMLHNLGPFCGQK